MGNPIPGPESLCEPFRPVIEEKLQQGLTGQRIYQDLVESHSLTASYSSVRRFLRRLDQSRPLPFRRLEMLSRLCSERTRLRDLTTVSG